MSTGGGSGWAKGLPGKPYGGIASGYGGGYGISEGIGTTTTVGVPAVLLAFLVLAFVVWASLVQAGHDLHSAQHLSQQPTAASACLSPLSQQGALSPREMSIANVNVLCLSPLSQQGVLSAAQPARSAQQAG